MYHYYTNEGNELIKPEISFTTFPFFNSVVNKKNGYPFKLFAPENKGFIHPFLLFNSKTVNVLFHIVQN
jgi:hypothetical protein